MISLSESFFPHKSKWPGIVTFLNWSSALWRKCVMRPRECNQTRQGMGIKLWEIIIFQSQMAAWLKTWAEKSHDCRFPKAPFSTCFPSTRKWKAGVFKFLRFEVCQNHWPSLTGMSRVVTCPSDVIHDRDVWPSRVCFSMFFSQKNKKRFYRRSSDPIKRVICSPSGEHLLYSRKRHGG